MTYVTILMTIITLIGTVGNSFQKSWCFYIWIPTNCFWIFYNLYISEYAQAIIYSANLITSIIGLINWTRKEQERKKQEINSLYNKL